MAWKNPFTPAPSANAGWGPVKTAPDGRTDGSWLVNPGGALVTAPSTPRPTTPGKSGASGASGASSAQSGINAAQARANATAKMSSRKQNEATAALVDQQRQLIDSFSTQRDIKLANIARAFSDSDSRMLENYRQALGGLEGTKANNEKAEADASFGNVANAIRERTNILTEAASNGAGESDLLRSQLAALRNYSANQGEVNRSFYDTLQSINNSITSLNNDTANQRTNLHNQAEADRESAWANYANQTADAWTQIMNIESANTNINSDTSEAYNRRFADAGTQAANAVKNSYSRQAIPAGWTEWAGKGKTEDRKLSSTNRAASINLSGPQRRPEGATLRRWEQ